MNNNNKIYNNIKYKNNSKLNRRKIFLIEKGKISKHLIYFINKNEII